LGAHAGNTYIQLFLSSAREEAVKQGLELQAKHFIHHVTFDHEFKDEWLFFRLLGDGHLKALNAKLSYACIPRPGFVSSLSLIPSFFTFFAQNIYFHLVSKKLLPTYTHIKIVVVNFAV
jgi:hypothetical protein